MDHNTTGISDLAFHVPPLQMDMTTLTARRAGEVPNLGRHLERALRTTGQLSLRFPQAGEDTATMAAGAAHALLRQQAARGSAGLPALDPASLRYLVCGTETGLDHSKPLSAYVAGMLAKAGHVLPATASNFQVQHACAGATLAAMSVAALLGGYGRDGDSALVLASDIARYQTKSTAEVTQGAGAAAVLLSRNPDLLELDLATMGFASADVDDFFRPLGSVVAQVNGRYSMDCYYQAFDTALADHAARSGRTVAEILRETDFFVLHSPFARMPVEAMNRTLENHLGLDAAGAAGFLAGKGFAAGLEPVARIGNTYTASVFMVLGWILKDLQLRLGQGMVGKRMLMASYGSGNTMVVLSGTVAPRAPEVVARWDLAAHLAAGVAAEWADYLAWTESGYGYGTAPGSTAALAAGLDNGASAPAENPGRSVKTSGFRLAGVRPDGYRLYDWTAG